MKCRILHESHGKIRVHIERFRMTLSQADLVEYYLKNNNAVTKVTVYDRTGDVVITYERGHRAEVISALSRLDYGDEEQKALVPEHTGRLANRQFEEKLTFTILGKLFRTFFFPNALKMVWNTVKAIPYLLRALNELIHGRVTVPVLDGAAIWASILQGDFGTAGNIMFLLHIGDILEDWTHQQAVDSLTDALSLHVDKVWVRSASGEDVLVPVNSIAVGDQVVVRTSNIIPLDGIVVSGEGAVNQASMTGEAVPVVKEEGAPVFAGTVVDEGEIVYRVTKTSGAGRYDQIAKMIEDSEKLKSETETAAYHLADSFVPWAFVGMGVTYLLTRNLTRAMSFLMVDFSCALKLSMPLTVISAMREAGAYDITVKGGKYLEAAAKAETLVLDKTGTLTHACPKVVALYTFNGTDETEALRIAACLEEHFPHSVANAVVAEAEARGIDHEEMHTKVDYIVAHGIASTVGGKRAVIGSYHFVFEDEGVPLPEDRARFNSIPEEYSTLYLAIDGQLTLVIAIFDPLREEASTVINEMHALGVERICMMTGDSRTTARAVAKMLSLDDFRAEVLPEDKAEYVKLQRALGRGVMMVGDGINDTPALSEADVGIAVSDGAAIAREVADVTLSGENLYQLVMLRRIAMAMQKRINGHYRFIMSFNSLLILLGALGVLTPATASLLHNTSTILIGLKSLTNLLPEEEKN
ncbi:MAG: heavy metal translocating P-type ATPase [Lachnospiraceae bacterium]|nr:heavy metal translocating P-type ATPase [Lachnospiraceae bacterium]